MNEFSPCLSRYGAFWFHIAMVMNSKAFWSEVNVRTSLKPSTKLNLYRARCPEINHLSSPSTACLSGDRLSSFVNNGGRLGLRREESSLRSSMTIDKYPVSDTKHRTQYKWKHPPRANSTKLDWSSIAHSTIQNLKSVLSLCWWFKILVDWTSKW